LSELWKKANIKWDFFQKSPIGKFILEKILFRSKGFISVFYTFVVMLLAQIASLTYVDKITAFLENETNRPEFISEFFWEILKFFAPEGNIWLIVVLIPASFGLWWIRNKELTIEKKPKELTGHAYTEGFVGRTKELKLIEKRLKSSSSLLLINGIGGIGKTSLANEYLAMHKKRYAHYAFINAQTDVRLSLFQQFEKSLNLTKQESVEADFREVLGELRKLDGKKLLVIDDIQEVKKQKEYIAEILKLRDRGFELLFTSREKIEDVQSHHLDVLDEEEAKELFNSIVKVADEKLLEEILVYLDYHTLFIEITAKTLKENHTLTPEKLLQKFKDGEFAKVNKNLEESFSLFLSNLFSFDKLNKEAILQLKQLSALPSIEIAFQKLVELLGIEEQEKFELILNYLSSRGWLIKSEYGYKLHQIIKEYLLDKHTPTFGEIEVIVDGFIRKMGDTADAKVAVENRENIIYFENLIVLFRKLNIENEKIGYFFASFGLIYQYLGFYQKAEPYISEASEIYERLFGVNHESTAISYANLGELYRLMEEYEKAEPFYLKALDILEKLLGKEHLDTATVYNNLAILYHLNGDIKKAKPLYTKALNIFEKELGSKHYSIATLYNNLAGIYESVDENKNAEILYLKDLKISENLLGKEHPDTATSYNNLAFFYYRQGDYEKAYWFMKKAVDVRSKVLPSNHPYLIKSKKGLEVIEERRG